MLPRSECLSQRHAIHLGSALCALVSLLCAQSVNKNAATTLRGLLPAPAARPASAGAMLTTAAQQQHTAPTCLPAQQPAQQPPLAASSTLTARDSTCTGPGSSRTSAGAGPTSSVTPAPSAAVCAGRRPDNDAGGARTGAQDPDHAVAAAGAAVGVAGVLGCSCCCIWGRHMVSVNRCVLPPSAVDRLL